MKCERAQEILHVASGIGLPEIKAACDELSQQDCLAKPGEPFDAQDCAYLYLRVLASALPFGDFLDHVAHAPAMAAIVVEADGPAWTISGDALSGSPYIGDVADTLLVEIVERHIEAATVGETNLDRYPDMASIEIANPEGGRYAAMRFCYAPPVVKAPVSCALIFSDSAIQLCGPPGRVTSLSTEVLTDFGRELRSLLAPPMPTEAPEKASFDWASKPPARLH